jgi:hypothetical protein
VRRSLRFAAALAAAAAALAVPCRAEGATSAGSFRLAPGHAARPAFYFVVTSPGAAGVRVETSVPEPVTITIYAGTNAVRRTQGEKDIRLTVNATLELLATGHEWAVVVSGSAASTVGDGRITVESPACASGGSPSHPLDIWLQQHPAVAFHPTWNDRGRVASYSAWPNGMRDALRKAFDDGRAGRPPAVTDPPPNAWSRQPGDDRNAIHTAFAPDVARALYLETVAHSLRVEIDRLVPWLLGDFNGDELDALLASTSLFWWNDEQRGYEISEFDHGWAVPASPQVAWSFLTRERLLKPTRLDTISALVGWSAGLTHFSGPVSRENFQDHWGYDGDMPVSRALAGTRLAAIASRSGSRARRTTPSWRCASTISPQYWIASACTPRKWSRPIR